MFVFCILDLQNKQKHTFYSVKLRFLIFKRLQKKVCRFGGVLGGAQKMYVRAMLPPGPRTPSESLFETLDPLDLFTQSGSG